MNSLKVYFNADDISNESSNYLLDTYAITLLSTDEIVVGYYKPINKLFIELSTVNTTDSKLSLYYYKGTSFLTTALSDETKGLARSGFISWGRNLTNEVKTTVNGLEMFWYKIKVDVDTTAMVLDGLNLNFSSDQDLKEEYPNIMDMLPEGKLSFINFHVATRKDIISYFKSKGTTITSGYGLNELQISKSIDQFDLLEAEEVRDAAKFLTLAKIFYWVSDSVDDKWHQKAQMYEAKYGEKIETAILSLDKNDNGLEENTEKNAIQFVQIVRV